MTEPTDNREALARYLIHFSGDNNWDDRDDCTKDFWLWEADQILSLLKPKGEHDAIAYLEGLQKDRDEVYECGVYNGKADGIAEGIHEVVIAVNTYIATHGVKKSMFKWWEDKKKEWGI